MKKLIALFLTLMLVFCLAACRGPEDDENKGGDASGIIEDVLNGNGAIETPIIDLPLN